MSLLRNSHNRVSFLHDVNLNIRLLSSVNRWSVIHTIRNQAVAEHLALTGILAIDLINNVSGIRRVSDTGRILEGVLLHDIREVITCDISSPVNSFIKSLGEKWQRALQLASQEIGLIGNKPTKIDRLIVRYVDVIESVQFLMQEELMGNRLVGDCLQELVISARYARTDLEQLAHFDDEESDSLLEWERRQIGFSEFHTITKINENGCNILTTRHDFEH